MSVIFLFILKNVIVFFFIILLVLFSIYFFLFIILYLFYIIDNNLNSGDKKWFIYIEELFLKWNISSKYTKFLSLLLQIIASLFFFILYLKFYIIIGFLFILLLLNDEFYLDRNVNSDSRSRKYIFVIEWLLLILILFMIQFLGWIFFINIFITYSYINFYISFLKTRFNTKKDYKKSIFFEDYFLCLNNFITHYRYSYSQKIHRFLYFAISNIYFINNLNSLLDSIKIYFSTRIVLPYFLLFLLRIFIIIYLIFFLIFFNYYNNLSSFFITMIWLFLKKCILVVISYIYFFFLYKYNVYPLIFFLIPFLIFFILERNNSVKKIIYLEKNLKRKIKSLPIIKRKLKHLKKKKKMC